MKVRGLEMVTFKEDLKGSKGQPGDKSSKNYERDKGIGSGLHFHLLKYDWLFQGFPWILVVDWPGYPGFSVELSHPSNSYPGNAL